MPRVRHVLTSVTPRKGVSLSLPSGSTARLRCACPRGRHQVQQEKQDLENTLEAEQECLVNKMQAQMRDMQMQNAYVLGITLLFTVVGLSCRGRSASARVVCRTGVSGYYNFVAVLAAAWRGASGWR